MRSLTSLALMVLGLLLMLGMGAGCSDDEPLTVKQLDELLFEAGACSPGDRCVVVDTHCCPRAINELREAEVRDALDRTDTDPSQCLADCIGPAEDLVATCTSIEDELRCDISVPQ